MTSQDKKKTDTPPTGAANRDTDDGRLQPDELENVVGGVAQVGLNAVGTTKPDLGGVKIASQWKVEEGEK